MEISIPKGLTTEQQAGLKRIEALHNYVKSQIGTTEFEIGELKEFIAEAFSNSQFQQRLAEIGAQREAAVDVGVMDAFNAAIASQTEMAKAAGGWAASLSASVRPVVTYWIMALWSFIHIWFAWNAWLAGASPEVVFKTMMTVDFCALVSGTINFWFLDRTLKQRGL